MADTSQIGRVLQTRVAGVPVWAAGLGVIAAVVLGRRFLVPGAAASGSTATAQPPNQGIPPGFVPAPPEAPPPASTPAPTAGSLIAGSADLSSRFPGLQSAPIYNANGQTIANVPFGFKVTMTGGSPQTVNGVQTIPVTYLGISGFVDPRDYTPDTAGTGGPSRRSLWTPDHPLLRVPSRWPHYHVTAVGGPATIYGIARAAGVHPARLMMVNSHLRHQGYRVRPGQMVRIP